MSRKQIVGSGLLVLVIIGALAGWWLFGLAIRSDELTGPGAWATATPFAESAEATTAATLAAQLRVAGLAETPILDDTAIQGHLARYTAGKVSAAALTQYAADLQTLNALRGEADRQIPTPFWDVRTAGMDADHVTEYTLVNGLTQPALATYLEWMANCFTRFSAFKTDQAAGGEDTALDAALDMLLYTLDYLDATLGPLPADATAEVQQARSEQAVRMWQNIIAGT
ncbi:MAG: hypothetical protein KDE53_34905, partial [Caldilineaceae bacterium]|nr:hypothetical protein [Caldilineaceae bacterium]